MRGSIIYQAKKRGIIFLSISASRHEGKRDNEDSKKLIVSTNHYLNYLVINK